MAETLFTDILTRLRPGYKKGGLSFKDQGFEMMEEEDFTSKPNEGIVAVKGVK